jgi:hypothetical protein
MLREFRDRTGVRWRVWDVRPAVPLIDRRLALRRDSSTEDYPGAERRRYERRAATQVSEGWLAFDSVLGRRRLMQIPARWAEAVESQLSEWCEVANEAEARFDWDGALEY